MNNPFPSDPTDTETLQWIDSLDGHLRLIDQTRLPGELIHRDCDNVHAVREAIFTLRVRGAPAIGIAAAYGVCLGVRDACDDLEMFTEALQKTIDELAGSRPTAVNLFWTLDRMDRKARSLFGELPPEKIALALLEEARAIHEEDRVVCRAIGRHGAELLDDGMAVLTHCNAGGLATADHGTALGVIYSAVKSGKQLHVYADETRPLLQGARLTAWELKHRNIPVTLICDSTAAVVMREGRVGAVITGADRIAANGDVANKIGTYAVALAAAVHNIPFYVAAPASTFDLTLADGSAIPIEERPPEEITHVMGLQIAPEGIDVYNPAFDVTPASLIKALICEHGVITPVSRQRIAQVLRV